MRSVDEDDNCLSSSASEPEALCEAPPSESITRYMYTGDRVPNTMEHNNQTYHLLYNHQGSLRAVADSNGTIVKEVQYDAFGNITLDTNSALHVNFGFAGGLYDSDTKLTRFGYRDYQAETGKWTAKDPIGFQGGDSNLYGYVLGDPVNLVDPRGEASMGLQPVFTGPITPGDVEQWNNSMSTHAGNNEAPLPYGPFGGICGAEGSIGATWIPDISPDACRAHDACYADCTKTQEQCDYEFYRSNPYYAIAVILAGRPAYENAQSECTCK